MSSEQHCDSCELPRTSGWQHFKEFILERQNYSLEWQMLQYAVVTFLILMALTVLAYFLFWRNDPLLLAKRGWWFAYLLITIVSTGGALWHYHAHRAKMSTMTGMMIGMTMGMQSGLMVSVVIGSTNGMFMGSFLGMIFGLVLGVYAGSSSGIMGILQGGMAGVMGGTMGPMIALMMRNDHILWFMPLFTIINVLILLGLSFLVYEEVAGKEVVKKPVHFVTFFSYCLITTAAFLLVIIYGYKSAFVI